MTRFVLINILKDVLYSAVWMTNNVCKSNTGFKTYIQDFCAASTVLATNVKGALSSFFKQINVLIYCYSLKCVYLSYIQLFIS